MMNNENLEIISWNSRSLYANLSEFKIFLYCNKPHIVCICESWLKSSHEPSFINYTSYFNHRINKSGGGTAILVRNDICAQAKDLNQYPNGGLEIQSITVFANKRIDIINIYNPSKSITKDEFIFYFKQIYHNGVVVGDFNGHHKMWDSRSTPNKTGHSLVDCLVELNNFELLTPLNFPTYLNVHNNLTSTLDLLFVSPSLCSGAQISLERPLGSDHRPIRLSLPVGPTFRERERRQLWKVKEVNWSAWRTALTPVRYEGIVDVDYANLISSMTKACEITMKRSSKIINLKYATPWWTDECKQIVNGKNRASKVLRRCPTPENLKFQKNSSSHLILTSEAADIRSLRTSSGNTGCAPDVRPPTNKILSLKTTKHEWKSAPAQNETTHSKKQPKPNKNSLTQTRHTKTELDNKNETHKAPISTKIERSNQKPPETKHRTKDACQPKGHQRHPPRPHHPRESGAPTQTTPPLVPRNEVQDVVQNSQAIYRTPPPPTCGTSRDPIPVGAPQNKPKRQKKGPGTFSAIQCFTKKEIKAALKCLNTATLHQTCWK